MAVKLLLYPHPAVLRTSPRPVGTTVFPLVLPHTDTPLSSHCSSSILKQAASIRPHTDLAVWYIRSTPLPPASSSSAPPTSSSAAPPPDGPTYGSRLIHPGGRTDLCLSVLGGAVANGYEVSV